MANELSNLFDSVLLVPMEEDEANCLEELYDDVVGNDNFDIIGCVCSFVTFEKNGTKDILKTLYENKYEKSLLLPDVCYHLYDQYIVYRYVCQDEDIEHDDKLKVSLCLRNELTLVNGEHNQMASNMFVEDICDYYKTYVHEAVSSIKDIKPLDILGQDSFTQAQMADAEFFNRIKVLAIKAAKYDLNMVKSQMRHMLDNKPYMKAFHIAQKLANVAQWEYVITDVESIMSALLSQYTQKRQLAVIKRELRDFLNGNMLESVGITSVVLGFLYKGENEVKLNGQTFSPLSFAMKLYYEFLSEKY